MQFCAVFFMQTHTQFIKLSNNESGFFGEQHCQFNGIIYSHILRGQNDDDKTCKKRTSLAQMLAHVHVQHEFSFWYQNHLVIVDDGFNWKIMFTRNENSYR